MTDIERVTGEFLEELQKLTKLDLSNKGLTELPISIGELKSLFYLYLRDNELKRYQSQ